MINLARAVSDHLAGNRLRRRRLCARPFHQRRPRLVPEVPRRDRRRINPQSALLAPGSIFRLLIRRGVVAAQFFRIGAIEPRHPAIDLLQGDVFAVERNFANGSPISILLTAGHRHRLTEDKIRQTLLRETAEVLITLWRVYAVEANLMLLVAGVQNPDRIPIAHTYHLAGDGLRLRKDI